MSHNTPGPWRKGKGYASVVSDTKPAYRAAHPSLFEGESVEVADASEREAYGGFLIAESICPENQDVIAAAPELYQALRDLAESHHCYPDARSCSLDGIMRAARGALAKAEGRA